jgi:hypothetical protein
MCVQCMAGAMTAAAGATGARTWLVSRFGHLMTPRRKRALSALLIVAGVIASGVIGPTTG